MRRRSSVDPRKCAVLTAPGVIGHDWILLRRAPVVLVLTGLFQRSRWKYRARHYRYVCGEGVGPS